MNLKFQVNSNLVLYLQYYAGGAGTSEGQGRQLFQAARSLLYVQPLLLT